MKRDAKRKQRDAEAAAEEAFLTGLPSGDGLPPALPVAGEDDGTSFLKRQTKRQKREEDKDEKEK